MGIRRQDIRDLARVRLKWVKGLCWEIYGKSIENPDLKKDPTSFLFICRGNICRSPFAENIARKVTEKIQAHPVYFSSAGLSVSKASPPPEEAILAGEHFGVKLSNHRSKGIDRVDLYSADMIIAMENWHFRALRKQYPHLKHKIFLLPLFDPSGNAKCRGFDRYNIHDPYSTTLQEFIACFQRIERCVRAVLDDSGVLADG
jgi:protein-tyrosine phosphatase